MNPGEDTHSSPGYQPLFLTTRGQTVESVHYGAAAVVTAGGKLFAQAGDARAVTFLRSSAKPFQAIPLVELGGLERFRISGEELAVICASHSGTDRHLQVIHALQKKIGITQEDLLCCTHPPLDKASCALLKDQGASPTQNHHNCSGKHTGMLGQAALLGAPKERYTEVDHPVQQGILAAFSQMAGLDPGQISLGRDGCSVPTFAVPLFHAAWAWARLVDPTGLPPQRAAACRSIAKAMAENPFFVAGPGRMDTRLMELAPDRIVSKGGAEAFQAVGIRPGAIRPDSPALGIAIKIAGGDLGKRALSAVTLELLRQLGVLSAAELEGFSDLGPTLTLRNACGIATGEGTPCFQLQYS